MSGHGRKEKEKKSPNFGQVGFNRTIFPPRTKNLTQRSKDYRNIRSNNYIIILTFSSYSSNNTFSIDRFVLDWPFTNICNCRGKFPRKIVIFQGGTQQGGVVSNSGKLSAAFARLFFRLTARDIIKIAFDFSGPNFSRLSRQYYK